ncbi:MAG: hypothetical protein ACTHLE_22590 [Agriterribacter sp.]
MIKELVNFTNTLDEDFKNLGVNPREGLHIVLTQKEAGGKDGIDTENYQYALFSKKMSEESPLLAKCKFLSQNAWCIDTNKCFDLPTKAIHSCSPYLIAFKREHLKGGEKFKTNQTKRKVQIYDRFDTYFEKAENLFQHEEDVYSNQAFRMLFISGEFEIVLNRIFERNKDEYTKINTAKEALEQQLRETKEKDTKDELKKQLKELDEQLLKARPLEDSDYILFYLDKSLEDYRLVHSKYLADKLFNTDKYNTPPDSQGIIYGTSNFMNGYNSSMPFLTHQTASFDITGRISNADAKSLYEFEQILPRKILPNPLPLFVYKEELQRNYISLYKSSEFKLGYKELISELWDAHKNELANYYLLNWQNTKDGLIFQDFDFVSKFEYEIDAKIENFFQIREKKEKGGKPLYYPKINNVFDLEQHVFKPLLQNKYLRLDYFSELKKDEYEGYNNAFQAYSKYRKAIYDYIYKSKRQGITEYIFTDMVFSRIKDYLKQDDEYTEKNIKEKLNLWFSLYETFKQSNNQTRITMASKLRHYQDFVARLSKGEADTDTATDADFAFAAGQVIDYILDKSKSEDKSYQLLEPYLQQSESNRFKKAIANDIARYKHAITDSDWRFKAVCDFVLTYETAANIKDLMPEILAGVFSECQFFSKKESKKADAVNN